MQTLKEIFTDPFAVIALSVTIPCIIIHLWASRTGRYDDPKDK